MTTPTDLEAVLRQVMLAGQRLVPSRHVCECGLVVGLHGAGTHQFNGALTPDESFEWARVLTLGRPAKEGEVCPETHDGLGNGSTHPWTCAKCGNKASEPPGRIGAQAGIGGLLVPCDPYMHRLGEYGSGPCYYCGQDVSGEPGLILNPLLCDAIEAGEWGAVIGMFEDRLRAGGVERVNDRPYDNGKGWWYALTYVGDPERPFPRGDGPTCLDALLDALRRAVEAAIGTNDPMR